MKRRYLASTLSVIALLASSICNSAHAVTFTPPTNSGAPKQTTGGASRGNFFIPASAKGAPRQATGGASRGSMFTPASGKGAPRQATGGASRGSMFTPASGKGTPQQATGGASRGNLFTPTAGKGTPQQATGGASRGNLFTPTADKGTPQQAAGGASRGNLFTPSADKGTPQQASGGASRVGNYYLNPSSIGSVFPAALIALLPESFYGTTVSERPTILVYLPASNAEEAVFSLKDESGNTQYQMTIPVALKAGVIAVKLPSDAPALAVGKNCHWFLAVKVDGQLSPSTPYIDGWIQRIQATAELATVMQQQDPLKRAAGFGKNGVWYDCVETLAAIHSAEPTNVTLTKQWEELLSSVSLKEIVTVPLFTSAN